MKERDVHLALEGDDLVVRSFQDAQDIADRAKMLREQPQHGDFHHRWSIPNNLVDQFFQEYCGIDHNSRATGPVKEMDSEFWAWVHQKMKDPQYKVFWCHDDQYQYRVGYTPSIGESIHMLTPALKGLAK